MSPRKKRARVEESPEAYAARIILAQASGEEDGVRLSFFSMGSPAKNSQQTAAHTAMLGECVDLVAFLTRHNSIVLPG